MNNAKKDVLIIEDDRCIRESLSHCLTVEGYNPICVRNGREALDFLHNETSPSIILLDLKMPDFDGWNFMEARKSFGLAPQVPTIVMSGEQLDGPLPDTASFLKKPLDLDHLIATIRQHCDN